jgi:hypothetical protein
VRKPGLHADGDGLYLQIANSNSRSWIFRYALNGRTREMGLGSLKAVSLAAARAKASQCRAQLADGIDPIAARDAERARLAIENARTITFDQCAEAFIRTHASTWRNPKHHARWKNTLVTYVSPVFGSLPVQAVDVGLVMKVLEPIWTGLKHQKEKRSMEHFAGLNVSFNETNICIVDETGRIVRCGRPR